MQLLDIAKYLDDYLAIKHVPDWPNAFNGLQVDGRVEVRKVATAVDACTFTVEAAVHGGADLIIVHHGLFWGAKAPLTGAYFKRVSTLIRNDLALYSCHTPLDAHPEVGNNHVLARKLGLKPGGLFGEMEGVPMGVWAETDVSRDDLINKIALLLNFNPTVIATGPERIRKVGIITGGAGTWIDRAAAIGCDTFITGEGPHHTYFDAEERGMNAIYAGHYATETVGVQALGEHLEKRFGLETFFIDHPTGL
jgi:dinuclear metal center YbgI/SA1388 family protein